MLKKNHLNSIQIGFYMRWRHNSYDRPRMKTYNNLWMVASLPTVDFDSYFIVYNKNINLFKVKLI